MGIFILKEIKTENRDRVFKLYVPYFGDLTVHYYEYDEDLIEGQKSKKRYIGDTINGTLNVNMVSVHKIDQSKLFIEQPFEMSPFIKMTGIIDKKIDDYSYRMKTSIPQNILTVEFESKVYYVSGEKIYFEGILNLEDSS